MTAPGVREEIIDPPPSADEPTDLSTWFVTGRVLKGAAGKALGPFRSVAELVAGCGDRSGVNIMLYDSADEFFHEGAGRMYVSRVAGAGLTTASLALNDAAAAVSLTVSAKSPGAWGNGLSVAVLTNADDATIPVDQFKLQISQGGSVVETSTALTSQADAVAWGANSSYVVVALGAAADNPARLAATVLAGGADGATPAESDWTNALLAFVKDLGPGQVSAPGRTTDAAHRAIADHIADKKFTRVAALDFPDTHDVPTLVASAVAVRNLASQGNRFAAPFAPWPTIPGVLPGTLRTVPPSALYAGIVARNDAGGISPGQPAAGQSGVSRYATGLSQDGWSEADRDTLNAAGVNVIRSRFGQILVFGDRSLADPVTDANWVQFHCARLAMALIVLGETVLEPYEFKDIDGQNKLFAQAKGDLIGAYLPFWTDGSLYGATPADAFRVDTGPTVNTPQTIAAKEIHARVSARISPSAEVAVLQISKVPTTQEIS